MKFSILSPEATTNYITNPTMRYLTTGWTAEDATLTRTLTRARFGIASLQVLTFGSANNEGAFFRVSELSGISEAVTVSAYVRGSGTVRIRLDDNTVGGGEFTSQPVVLSAERWTRISVSGFSTGGNDMRLHVETAEGAARVRTFYVDGAQMERKPYPTTYCDGDQEGCRWNGVAHESTSERNASTRAGGHWVQLAGEEREAQDLYMTTVGGLGMATLLNDKIEFNLDAGGYVRNQTVPMRVMTFVLHARHTVGGRENPVSLAHLHALRETLIDLINPEGSPAGEAVRFEYQDGDIPLYFQARYEGGLEGDWDIRNPFMSSFPLRLLAVSPFLYEDSQEAQVLDFQEDSQTMRRVIGRRDGRWDNMNYGANGAVGDLELGARGELVAAGVFGFVNFNGAAVAPFLATFNITYFDGIQWQRLAGSFSGVAINDVAIATNGDIYAAGNFTMIDGVAANNIARWDGTQWNPLGTGLDNDGVHVAFDVNGRVYVGGRFGNAGGVPASRVAFWDGSSWHGMGQYSGVDAIVNTIAVTPDGTRVYLGGLFVSQGGFPLLHAALYDPATDRFTQLGDGFNGDVREILLDSGLIPYASGDFTLSGTSEINRIGKFVGGTWLPLGSGMDDNVLSFDIGPNGDIIAVGDFSTAGGHPCRNIALWNGTTWTNLDIEIAKGDVNLTLLAVQYNPNGDVFIGGGWTATFPSLFPAINTVTNPGTTESRPVVTVQGPGRLRWLENQTARKRLFFDMTLLPGEEVVLDFEHGTAESNKGVNVFGDIIPGSDFAEFSLLPGDNKLAVFMDNDVNAQMQIRFQPSYWSVDATESEFA